MQLIAEHSLTSSALRVATAPQTRPAPMAMVMTLPAARCCSTTARRSANAAASAHARRVMHPLRAAQAEATTTQQTTDEGWYAIVANAQFMLHDVQNESFAEQLREKARLYKEQGKEIDFFLVSEPAWLDTAFPSEAKQVGRPCVALVCKNKTWATFMKLRLDRVLMLDLAAVPEADLFKSNGAVPEFPAREGWTAPYSPYAPGWWEVFMRK